VQTNKGILTEPHGVVQPVTQIQSGDVIVIDDSDNSDVEVILVDTVCNADEVIFVGSVYNPKLDTALKKSRVACNKGKQCTQRAQDNSTSKPINIAT
jgi:hypothetical protein